MEYKKEVKCVIWDLDNTIWDNVLTESKTIKLKTGIEDILNTLDSRGILNSISSKNNYDDAMRKLKEFSIDHYFLYPQINWNAKSASVAQIQKDLNIGIDTIVFIDDQPYEREEVKSQHPQVECIDSVDYKELLSRSRFNPKFITKDSQRRRLMYLENIKRTRLEEEYEGPKDEFLASLNMEFIISEAAEEDLQRAEELTVRTNQLNATGKTYSYKELNYFRSSPNHKLLVCELKDKYGSYGKIGLGLIHITEITWEIKLLLMSCRVISRGVGSVLLSYIMKQAKTENKKVTADFIKTDRNKMMYVTYKFSNFKEVLVLDNGYIKFENTLEKIQEFPPYIKLSIN